MNNSKGATTKFYLLMLFLNMTETDRPLSYEDQSFLFQLTTLTYNITKQRSTTRIVVIRILRLKQRYNGIFVCGEESKKEKART